MPDPAKQLSAAGPMTPLITVTPDSFGVTLKLRGESIVLPKAMAVHLAAVILSHALIDPPPKPEAAHG